MSTGQNRPEVFARVFDAIVDVVLVIDLVGQIVMANPAAESVTGYSLSELYHLAIAKVLSDEHSGVRTAVRRRIEEGAVLRREDGWLLAKTGRIPVSVIAAPLVDEAGDVTGIVLVVRDTSELRRLLRERDSEIKRREDAEQALKSAMGLIEQRLEASRAQLLLAERRATLGTLAGGVGHELRNIAQIQVGAIETVRGEVGKLGTSAEIDEALSDLEGVAEHVTLHARRLMQLAKPGPDHVRPLDLNRVIEDVVAMLEGAGKLRAIKMLLVLDEGGVLVTVNKTRIEQILVNLVVNAADAIGSSGGKITLAVRRDQERHRIVVEVTDTGPGIAPEVLPHIFEPFFTTKSEEVGTGLGLPVIREIVESYGGELVVSTTVGVGTTFRFDLPISDG